MTEAGPNTFDAGGTKRNGADAAGMKRSAAVARDREEAAERAASPADERRRLAATLMVQGTASDVGKSVVTAALCRIFTQDGWRTAPFKSQNMSLNSYVTRDGKEIGRAQGMQADACGIPATTDMNPILLKPSGEMRSQVVVHGKPLGEYDARAYREHYLPIAGGIARDALRKLRERNDIVVLEGAGSPAEINLKDRDIVNMRMAQWADAPVILVADIDRGGVFASLVGTLELLEPEERERVCGFVINKFRGDIALLQPGLDWLERRTGKPVLGVLPYLPNLALEAEDSLSLDRERARRDAAPAPPPGRTLDIAVVRLPRISNFTDFDPLAAEDDVRLRYVDSPEQWGDPDAVLLPGSKNTIADLIWLREQGLETVLLRHARGGGWLAGICGGYEMLGRRLLDPLGVESDIGAADGLNLFPFEAEFLREKRTVRAEGFVRLHEAMAAVPIEGYEIHMGAVRPLEAGLYRPFRIRERHAHADGKSEPGGGEGRDGERPQASSRAEDAMFGAGSIEPARLRGADAVEPSESYGEEGVSSPDGRMWGTFIHGVFHNDEFRRAWLNGIRLSRGWEALPPVLRYRERREAAFDQLAEHARRHLNMPLICRIAGLRPRRDEA